MSESQLFQFLRINAAHRSHRQMTLMGHVVHCKAAGQISIAVTAG